MLASIRNKTTGFLATLVCCVVIVGCSGGLVPLETTRVINASARSYDRSGGVLSATAAIVYDRAAQPHAALLAASPAPPRATQVRALRTIGRGNIFAGGSFSFAYDETLPDDVLVPFDSLVAFCAEVVISDRAARAIASNWIDVEGGGKIENLSFDPGEVPSAYTQVARIYLDRAVSAEGNCMAGSTPTTFDLEFVPGWNSYALSVSETGFAYLTGEFPTEVDWYYQPAALTPVAR